MKEPADIEVSCIDTDRTEIAGDALKLRQVLENLIRNAMESFDGVAATTKKIVVSTVFTATNVHIRVADNGAGLPANLSTQVFDPFLRRRHAAPDLDFRLPMRSSVLIKGRSH